MEIGLQYQLLIVILLVCFLTYFITRNYFNFIVKMQNKYIDNLRNEFNSLEKTHKDLHDNVSTTMGHLSAAIEDIEIKVDHIQNNQNHTMKEIRKYDK